MCVWCWGTSQASPAWRPSLSSLCLQILEALSSNLVMEVLRSAPGGLQKQLPYLPRSLAPLAALAHIPGLAATCSPASDCSDQGASEGYTALTLCVDTSPVESAVEAGADEADDAAVASMLSLIHI